MHYKNGREAKENDPVIAPTQCITGQVIAGKLQKLIAGSDSCNAQIVSPTLGGYETFYVTVGQCYHAEDALSSIEAATTGTPPEQPSETQTK